MAEPRPQLGDDPASDLPSTSRSHNEARVAGVRFPGSSGTYYVTAGAIDVDVGDWVAVAMSGGREIGCVVFAPSQVRLDMLHGDLAPIERRLDEPELEQVDLGELKQVGSRDETRRLGGLGRIGLARGGASVENEWYQQMKADLPRLGEVVETPQGAGVVMALQISKDLVTVRLAEDDSLDVFSSAALGFKQPT